MKIKILKTKILKTKILKINNKKINDFILKIIIIFKAFDNFNNI